MKKYYFIDFDSIKKLNVNENNFECKSYIQLFYIDSHHPKNIDLDSLQVFTQYAKKVDFIKVPDEKHLLGKYVCGSLGKYIGECKDPANIQFIIVSPKVSYDPYIAYLCESGYNVIRIDNFNPEEKKTPEKKKKEKKEVTSVVSKKKEKVKKEPKVKVEPKVEIIPEVVIQEETPVVPVEEKVIEELPQEVVEIVEEVIEVDPLQPKYDEVYQKVKGALSKAKNSNGNKYSPKARKDIPRIIIRQLKMNHGLEDMYNQFKNKYQVTYTGIYDIIHPIVLEVFDELEDFIPPVIVEEVVEPVQVEETEPITIEVEEPTQEEVVEEVIEVENPVEEVQEEINVDPPVDEPVQEVVVVEEVITNDPIVDMLKEYVEEDQINSILSIIEESKQPDKKNNFIYLSLSKQYGRNLASTINRNLKELMK